METNTFKWDYSEAFACSFSLFVWLWIQEKKTDWKKLATIRAYVFLWRPLKLFCEIKWCDTTIYKSQTEVRYSNGTIACKVVISDAKCGICVCVCLDMFFVSGCDDLSLLWTFVSCWLTVVLGLDSTNLWCTVVGGSHPKNSNNNRHRIVSDFIK